MKIRFYPYKQGSRSAKLLAETMGGKVLRHVGSKFRPRRGDTVINWGSSKLPNFGEAKVLNRSDAITVASNKLLSFNELKEGDVSVPEFTTSQEVAKEMLRDGPVVCRQKLTGHSGEGIVIAEKIDELVKAPLYTRYVKKKDEYRVHIVRGGEAFFIQRKARKLDVENPDWRIRNLAGGFVFVEEDKNATPVDVIRQSKQAIETLGLDFGGVDVIWNEREQKAYVLEVNTACGLEERTAEKYADALGAIL